MQVFVHHRPHLAGQLVSYQTTISRFANEYHLNAWYAYDAAFRQRMANNPMLSWSTVDDEIFNAYLRSAPILPSTNLLNTPSQPAYTIPGAQRSGPRATRLCFTCSSPDHVARVCPLNNRPTTGGGAGFPPRQQPRSQMPFRAPPSQSPAWPYPDNCKNWNNGYPCPTGATCTREHRCNFCNGLHARHSCRNYQAWVNSQQRQPPQSQPPQPRQQPRQPPAPRR